MSHFLKPHLHQPIFPPCHFFSDAQRDSFILVSDLYYGRLAATAAGIAFNVVSALLRLSSSPWLLFFQVKFLGTLQTLMKGWVPHSLFYSQGQLPFLIKKES